MFCVGATKAGTSWLYRTLLRHPDCHLRSIKELHYFDMVESGAFARYRKRAIRRIETLKAERLVDGLAAGRAADRGKAAYLRRLRDEQDWLDVLSREGADLDAYRAFLTAGRGDKHLVADITPAYALLPVARLSQMAQMAGDVRAVYLLRDPLSRLWSQARMMAARKANGAHDFARRAVAVMEGLVDAILQGQTDREDYAGAVQRLRAAFRPQCLLVELQERLMTAPGLARLCAFLGIAPVDADFTKRVHEGAALTLDEGLRARALVALRPQYDFVANLFPDLPETWRRNMIGVHG